LPRRLSKDRQGVVAVSQFQPDAPADQSNEPELVPSPAVAPTDDSQPPNGPIVEAPLLAAPSEVVGLAAPVAVVPALTVEQFAASFVPAEGEYEVTLIHPHTCQPVTICFSLPCGCPRKTKVNRHEIEWDYGKEEVEIRFKKDGRILVRYDD
jgi:hypothetical protein